MSSSDYYPYRDNEPSRARAVAARVGNLVGDHKITSGIAAALVAYVPIGAATGYYPQFGPVNKTIASDSSYGYFTRGSATIETYEGVLFAEGAVFSNLYHMQRTCSTVPVTTKVGETTITTYRESCTTMRVSDPTSMQILSMELTDEDGRPLIPDAGQSSATWSLVTAERSEVVDCPEAGEQINLTVSVESYDGVRWMEAQAISDGECEANSGLRFSRPDGSPTDGIGF